jgi:hypothetical protein
MICRLEMSDAFVIDQEDVAEAGGEFSVIVAPTSPGLGAPDPSTKLYVIEPAWHGLLAGAKVSATSTRKPTIFGVFTDPLLSSMAVGSSELIGRSIGRDELPDRPLPLPCGQFDGCAVMGLAPC